jgi:phosphatidate cytidylyltransferase
MAGALATLPLFHFEYRRFMHSSLFIKILFWIPIFIIFTIALYLGNTGRLLLLLIILALALPEIRTAFHRQPRLVAAYSAGFIIAWLHFYILGLAFPQRIITLLITICFGSVLSDVFAFFGGNYLGKHHLPAWLNPGKSWEGVAGQIIGAGVGVMLVQAFVTPVPGLWLWIPIGLGSAAGDLANSFVKRRLGIKDWSHAIPGHGGYIDRLSSLAGSALLTFYALLIVRS